MARQRLNISESYFLHREKIAFTNFNEEKE